MISDVSDKLLEQFLSLFFRASRRRPRRDRRDVSSAAFAADADAGFDEADTEQTIELETVPATAGSSEVGSSAGADIAPSATEAPPPTAPPASEPSRYSSPSGDAAQSELNVFSTVVPVVLKRYGPALAVFGLLLFIVIKIIRRKS